jgi:demethylmenaquinone methyltransferase/2-methoxy-6-polyprenyl-1,4-benzoquinol methylase
MIMGRQAASLVMKFPLHRPLTVLFRQQATSHSKMDHACLAGIQRKKQKLRAPSERTDGCAFEALNKAIRKRKAQIRPAQQHLGNPGSFQNRRETTADGFHLREFGHRLLLDGLGTAIAIARHEKLGYGFGGMAAGISRREWQTMAEQSSETTHFGYTNVPLGEKQARVDDVFHKVASRYDLMNDLMSAGLHRAWKSILVAMLRPSKTRVYRHLDVAGGTGDVAFRVAEAGGPETRVTVLDINGSMLAVGADRAQEQGYADRVNFIEANAEDLPFHAGTFDSYTIAFGIRNVPRMERALSEAQRVLKRGGRFLCLEFAPVEMPVLDRIYDAYSFHVIPPMGGLVTGDPEPYRYLVESIRQFPKPALFESMIRDAGLARVSHRPLTGGIANIHSGWKL